MHFFANENTSNALSRCRNRILDTRKWHAEKFKEAAGLFIVARSGDYVHLEAAHSVYPIIVDLRKNDLLSKAQGVVASTVKAVP